SLSALESSADDLVDVALAHDRSGVVDTAGELRARAAGGEAPRALAAAGVPSGPRRCPTGRLRSGGPGRQRRLRDRARTVRAVRRSRAAGGGHARLPGPGGRAALARRPADRRADAGAAPV